MHIAALVGHLGDGGQHLLGPDTRRGRAAAASGLAMSAWVFVFLS
jgi:hypothetical protein